MTQTEFEEQCATLHNVAASIVAAKRAGYTQGNSDVLKNFKDTATATGTSPLQVWGVHFYKQLSAVMSYAKDPTIRQGETIESRFADLLNYVQLGYALYVEDGSKDQQIHIGTNFMVQQCPHCRSTITAKETICPQCGNDIP